MTEAKTDAPMSRTAAGVPLSAAWEAASTSAPVAVPLAPTDTEEGYFSDGSMPSLHKPTGSSNDDYDHI